MENITKIAEKLELQDVEVQEYNPCYAYWNEHHIAGQYDCLHDCYGGSSPYMVKQY